MALVAVAGLCAAQATPADKPARVFATQEEFNLASSIDKEPTPAGRLQKLEQWKKEYPTTNFADVRRRGFLVAYSQLGKPREAFNAALDILKEDNPNDELALRSVLAMIQGIQGPTPDEYQTAIRIAQQIVSNADVIYAADKKPAEQTDAQWNDLKKAMRPYAQKTIGWVYFVQKDLPKSETELIKALEMDPNQAATASTLPASGTGRRATSSVSRNRLRPWSVSWPRCGGRSWPVSPSPSSWPRRAGGGSRARRSVRWRPWPRRPGPSRSARPAPGSSSRTRATSWGRWRARSTTSSGDWSRCSPSSASSWPTRRTSCARRSPWRGRPSR
jgi:tetratricopeptide (TPR) repeat protein